MNKTELIAAMAEISSLSKKDCEAALTAFVAATENALKAGDKVQLVGFGTFEAKVRAAHIGRNPATGAEIKIPASKAPAFLPDLPRLGEQIHPAGLKQSESACRSS